jgi:IS5 family transposase
MPCKSSFLYSVTRLLDALICIKAKVQHAAHSRSARRRAGRSGLIFDVVIEAGNPADAERFIPMLERHIASNGTPPRQTTSDGGYASLDNLNQAKAMGVRDVTRSEVSRSKAWSRAAGSTASCATSGPASRRDSALPSRQTAASN